MAEPLLQAEDVHVQRGRRTVLHGVSLHAEAGEVLAVLGPNGAGKSTLLRAVAGLLPAEGRVRLQGRDVGALPARERARLTALVPQRSQLGARMTVRKVVDQGRYAHRGGLAGPSKGDARAVTEAMARVGVTPLADRFFTELSYGEQRRVLLARALATGAPLLLLDEPTASLDIAHALTLHRTLRGLAAEGRAVVIVLHDLNEARLVSDRALLLADGATVVQGPTPEVITAEHVAQVYGVELLEDGALGYRLPEVQT
jgi:iron complex transport system ATP-binding protein